MITYTFFILLVLQSHAASGSTSIITETLGANVILRCEAGDAPIRAVEWTREDLGPSEYVLFYRNRISIPSHQHPSFKGRVELVDGELKHGDVSLDLRDLRITDNGTYECRVAGGGSGRRKRSIIDGPPISSIRLQVKEPGSNRGDPKSEPRTDRGRLDKDQTIETPIEGQHIDGVAVAVAAAVVVCALACSAAFVLFLVRRKKLTRHLDEKSEQSAADKGADSSLLI